MNKLKTILFDIETSPNISYTWGKYEQDVIEFIEEGYILTFAYKELGKKQIKAVSLNDFNGNEEKLVKKLWELFDASDILIAHNGDNFDIKWANRMFAKYNISPPSPYKTIDTLKVARQNFKFNSNRLDDLGNYLGIGRKAKHEGFSLWKKCMAGDKKSYKDMIRYNKQDVKLLEDVYLKLRPYMKSHPTANISPEFICPVCGGSHIQKRGWSFTNAFMKQRLQCQGCGKWFLGQQIRYKEKNNTLK
ncbi:MAG: ribonuclease H-like domain-containing protein [Clostridia bacterium]|jgi:DNA polymerase elongation subunit (family B)|nr:ribonuclease H-like domain-containing protein [Clostridia bacterium]